MAQLVPRVMTGLLVPWVSKVSQVQVEQMVRLEHKVIQAKRVPEVYKV
jgi:hypothetical protein